MTGRVALISINIHNISFVILPLPHLFYPRYSPLNPFKKKETFFFSVLLYKSLLTSYKYIIIYTLVKN